MALQLVINGKDRHFEELSSGAILPELVRVLGFRPDRVAIEKNGDILPRTTWPAQALADGDRLEIVNFVGGGTASLMLSR